MLFTRLKLRARRNFDHVDPDLAERAFFVGPKASEKSNILDALRFLREAADDGLRDAVRRRGGVDQLGSLHTRNFPGFLIEADLGVPGEPQQAPTNPPPGQPAESGRPDRPQPGPRLFGPPRAGLAQRDLTRAPGGEPAQACSSTRYGFARSSQK